MNILITGIYGFLGSHLANQLVKEHNVFGLYHHVKKDNLEAAIETNNSLELVEFIPDLIIMCHAAVASGREVLSNELLIKTNVDFTQKVLKRFPSIPSIYISSVSVYGESNQIINEQTIINPLSAYAESKKIGEEIVMKNPKNKIIRLSSLYGEGMKENTLIPNYCNQALQQNEIQVWGKGTRYQNYIHVSDVVALIEEVIKNMNIIRFPILAVDSKEYSNLEVAQIIAKIIPSKIEFLNEDYSKSFFYNNKVSQKILNWQPKVNLATGIQNYLQWKERQS